MTRIFFALWPPAATARALAQWARGAQRATGGKVTGEDRIHLTLAFLGDVDAGRAAAAAERVQATAHELPLEEARYWKGNGIVWAGPREAPAPLRELHGRLERELYQESFILERRPFAAHVTLIRKARAAPLPALPGGLDWPVREFLLVRSNLAATGPSYEPLRRFALGFTLIEMMVVVAIVAILALMMIPTYHERYVRDQIVEAMPLADIAKRTVGLAWAAGQALPADNAAAGLPVADKIVSNLVHSVAVEQGAIHVTFGNRANNLLKGKILTLRPAVVEDAPVVPIAWVCGFAGGPEKMTIRGANRTNVPPAYLPLRCK